jgi:hypothetical protein
VSDDTKFGIIVTLVIGTVGVVGALLIASHARDQEQTNRTCITSGGQVILDNCVRSSK